MKTFIKALPKKQLLGFSFIFAMIMYMATGCNQGPPKNSRAAQALAGKALFNEQCSSCHGGENIAADKSILDTLDLMPPDLTRISKRRGVRDFPVAEIARIIDGRILAKAHGPREMPVWGMVYEDEGMDEGQIKGKKGELIAYLMSIQTMD
jgi:mono/diheme cytochrome c family protein